MQDTIGNRLSELGITLPSLPSPIANYVPFAIAGNLLFLAGQGSRVADGNLMHGRLGDGVTVDEAYQGARMAGLGLLAAAKAALGSLDRVKRIVKVIGFVNATAGFEQHAAVINGCSDLFVEVFGERGRHARTSLGVSSLPLNIAVEIEAVLEIGE